MNILIKRLHDTYNFDSELSGNFMGNFKICSFNNGEIISKDILKEGLGPESYYKLI